MIRSSITSLSAFHIPTSPRSAKYTPLLITKKNVSHFSTQVSSLPSNTKVHIIPPDSKQGAFQYMLLPSSMPFNLDQYRSHQSIRHQILSEKLASLYVSRNIVFGASSNSDMLKYCGPLVDVAISRAEEEGDQVHAMATLHGLCDWVVNLLETAENPNSTSSSEITKEEKQVLGTIIPETISYEAVKAIATGIPRPGHSVVGQGTYRDGKDGWILLAKQFAEQQKGGEVDLYKSKGAEPVEIEFLADTSERYLKSAGGSMLRMYFV